jgi:hypothetical protein
MRVTFDLDELTEREKCPACFGVNLCPPMLGNKIRLSDWTKYSISKFLNTKNTYFAVWNEKGVERQVRMRDWVDCSVEIQQLCKSDQWEKI